MKRLKTVQQSILILSIQLSIFSNSMANVDSLNIWVDSAQHAVTSLNLNELPLLIKKIRSINNESSLNPRAVAFADLYEAEYLKRREIDRAVQLATQSAEYFRSNEEPFFALYAMNLRGASISNTGKLLEAEVAYLKAQEYGKKHIDSDERIEKSLNRTLYSLGFVLVRYGDLVKATEYLAQTLENAIAVQDTFLWAHTLNMIGNVHIRRYEYEDALKVNQEGFALANAIGVKSATFFQSAIASVYIELGKLDSAEYHLNNAISMRRQEGNKYSLGILLSNLSEIHRKRGDCEKSYKANEEVLILAKEIGMQGIEISALINQCICYVRDQKYEKALKLVKDTETMLKESFQFNLAADLYECASDAASYLNKNGEALEYYKLYKTNTDSLLNERSESIIKDLQFRYESAKQKEEIHKLKEQGALSAIGYRNKVLILTTSLLLSLILGGGYFLYQRNKVNQIQIKKMEVEQKLLRSQMNPHFIFNAISSFQNFLFDKSDLKTALSYLSKFADLMRQTLEHSREEHITLEREIESLENYLALQQLRYQNQFEYKIVIDEKIDPSETLVPPLIAQPFVENSIEHGQIYRVEGGEVIISFELLESSLRLNIIDNGVGTKNSEKYSVGTKKSSLSTKITRERLQALATTSKQKFDLIVEQLLQGGTQVTIHLPKIQMS